jgi:alanyl-tRNA synthetase
LDEISSVENAVREVIAKNHTVHHDVIPLSEAKGFAGVRAVFGEHYPDPVRVLSIGCSVDNLRENPASLSWLDYSIEFCGGTHLKETGEAGDFAIIGKCTRYLGPS